MQIKKYKAETINEALINIKKILGPNAMIVSTKKLNNGSNKNLFEVTAMASEDDDLHEYNSPIREIKSELMNIKEMIYLLGHGGSISESIIMNAGALTIYTKLIRSGIHDIYARKFLETAGALNSYSGDTREIRERTAEEILKVIKVKDIFETRDKKSVVSAFIGTTGVGKTTTIAKLAAQQMLMKGKKVGLISIDNYRIGAMDQLKAYANILGIPCLPAFNKKDLLFALKRMGQKDLIFIDTAGHSQYDMSRIGELQKIITDDLSISTHLLLSVSTSETEMKKAAINFSPLKYKSYIFTKIDEAEACGSVINQIMEAALPVSYFTTGQSVPDDIEKAQKENILGLLSMDL